MKKVDSLSVFFPAYNEVANIARVVEEALKVLPRVADKFEVIVVNDGSTDQTEAVAKKLVKDYRTVRVISHQPNLGYGAALKSGFYNSKYDLIAFTDGDGQFDFGEVARFLEKIEDADLVIGYRKRRVEGLMRRVNAKLWGGLMWLLFGLHVKDVDCAFKLLRREVLERIPRLESDGALVSAELLIKAKRAGFRIVEVPVKHLPRPSGQPTGANFRVILKAFFELGKLWRRLR